MVSENNKFLISLISVLLLYFFGYKFFSVIFEDGDDVYMQQIIQGAILGKPDEHLVYINVIIGYLLKPLYELSNQVYWYSMLMLALQFLSILVIVCHLCLKRAKWYTILAVLFFCFYFIIKIQYTSISGLLAISGVLALNRALMSKSIKLYLLSFLLLTFSVLLRLEMFLLSILICLLFFIIENKHKIKIICKNNMFFIFLFSFILTNFIFILFNYNSYQSNKEWKYYFNYNLARQKINDNPNCKFLIKKLEREKNQESLDLILANNFFIYTDLYDLKKMEVTKKVISPNFKQKIINNYLFLKRDLSLENKNRGSIFFGLAFLLLMIFFLIKKRYYFYTLPILLILLFFIYINFELTLKTRVFFPIILATVIFTISIPNKNLVRLISISFISLSFYIVFCPNLYYNDKIKDSTYKLNFPKNKLVVLLSSNNFSYYPFNLNKLNNEQNLIVGGWLTNSPLVINKFKSKGINLMQHLSLIDNEIVNKNALYFINDNSKLLKMLTNYLSLRNKKIIKIKSNPNLFRILKK